MKNWQVATLAVVALSTIALIQRPEAPKSDYEQWKVDYGVNFIAEH